MITVEKRMVVDGTLENVYNIVSDMGTETDFWSGIRDIHEISSDGNKVVREAVVGPWAFGFKTRQTIVFHPNTSVELTLSGERASGKRIIELIPKGTTQTEICVKWDLEPVNVPGFVPSLISGHLSGVTENALKKFAGALSSGNKGRQIKN